MLAYLLNAWLNRVIVDEFEYEKKSFEPFPAETRIEPDELSYAQEMLLEEIPLHHRIAHISPYVNFGEKQRKMYEIASKLGVDDKWACRTAERIGIHPRPTMVGGELVDLYPGYTQALLEEERDWRKAYKALNDEVSLTAVAGFMARSPGWVRHFTSEIGVYPEYKRVKNESYSYFDKKVILELRHITLARMPAQDWMTVSAIEKFLGRKRSWIEQRLIEAGFESEERWSYKGKLLDHFPPAALDYLLDLASEVPAPAGRNLTVDGIAKLINRDNDWVTQRIKKIFPDAGELMLNNQARPSVHYDEVVIATLEEISEKDRALSYVTEEYVAISGLARAVGHDQRWIEKRLPFTSIKATRLINPVNNVPGDYYQREASVAELLALPENILRQQK